MTVLPVVFVLLVTTVIALLITLIVLGIAFGRLKLQGKQPPVITPPPPHTPTHEQAEQIIHDAEKKAADIIKAAHTFDAKAIEDMDSALADVKLSQQKTVEEIAQDILTTYKTIFDDIKTENINTIKNASKQIQEQALGEIKDFKRILDQETVTLQKIVGQKIEGEYHKASQEIEAYKQSQYNKIDAQLELMLSKATEQVLGKVIPMTEHHQLLTESLERAKKEGVFDNA